jgi:transcription elongation factor Elf1
MANSISKERAEKVAKAHACEHCGEYSYKKLTIKPATASNRKEFGEVWHCMKICGVCGMEQEMGIDAEGEIAYVN